MRVVSEMPTVRYGNSKDGIYWWESNPLVYDGWGHDPIKAEPGTNEYF